MNRTEAPNRRAVSYTHLDVYKRQMHSVLPVRKLIYEIARNLDKSVGQTVFCCVKYITKRTEFKTNFLRLNLLRKLYGLRAVFMFNI